MAAKTVFFSNDDACKDEVIAVTMMSSKGVMLKDKNGSMITNIIEPDEDKRIIIRKHVLEIMVASENGKNYQPDWKNLLKDDLK
jgi:hypothetical protein